MTIQIQKTNSCRLWSLHYTAAVFSIAFSLSAPFPSPVLSAFLFDVSSNPLQSFLHGLIHWMSRRRKLPLLLCIRCVKAGLRRIQIRNERAAEFSYSFQIRKPTVKLVQAVKIITFPWNATVHQTFLKKLKQPNSRWFIPLNCPCEMNVREIHYRHSPLLRIVTFLERTRKASRYFS
jgi:hypothetical protein